MLPYGLPVSPVGSALGSAQERMKGGQGFEQGAGADDGADELSSIPRCDYRLGKVERAAQDCLTICLETSGNRDFGVAFGQVDGIGEA